MTTAPHPFLDRFLAELELQAAEDAAMHRRLMATGGPVAVADARRRDCEDLAERLRAAYRALADEP